MSDLQPLTLLVIVVGLTAATWTLWRVLRLRRAAMLRRLAGQWQMSYVRQDLFNLARRIARDFPVPAAADLRVVDVIYGSEQQQHRYIFTIDYTVGVTDRHRRQSAVGTCCESREHGQAKRLSGLKIAPGHLPIKEQYESLRAAETKG